MRAGAIFVLLASLAIAGCTGLSYARGFVRDVQLEPRAPGAGQRVRIVVALHDPYIYSGAPSAGPRVTLQSTAGEVQGQGWDGVQWSPVSGSSVTVNPAAGMFWTLPAAPGEYTLTVSFDQNALQRKVRID